MQETEKSVPLYCVFHSIRFKVNKVGIRRYPFFYVFSFAVFLVFCTFALHYEHLCPQLWSFMSIVMNIYFSS